MIAVLVLIRVSPGISYGFLVSLEDDHRTRTKDWEILRALILLTLSPTLILTLYNPWRAASYSRPAPALRYSTQMFNSKPAHQAVQCKVSCSPHPWVQQPEDEGAEEAEAGEEKIDRKVNRWRWLRNIVKI